MYVFVCNLPSTSTIVEHHYDWIRNGLERKKIIYFNIIVLKERKKNIYFIKSWMVGFLHMLSQYLYIDG